MKTLAQLTTELDAANAQVQKLTRRDLKNGTGPSAEFKAQYRAAKIAWRLWSNALDVSEGREPCFPADGTLK